MRQIKIAFAALFSVLTVLWLFSDSLAAVPFTIIAMRTPVVNFSGVLAVGALSVAMILAARPVFVERALNGLDKMYRLHKWLGISGASLALAHLAAVQIPKWMISMGWIVRPARGGGPRPVADGLAGIMQSQRGAAESAGMLALYATVALVAFALLRGVPYRYFVLSHRLLAPVYLVMVYHAVVLLPPLYWRAPIGIPLGLLLVGGSVGAVVSLTQRIGAQRRTVGEVVEVTVHPDNHVLEVAVALKGRWPGHSAGQFAFVSFDRTEAPHPFTITSSWDGDGRLRFLIKALGDYTRRLPESVHVGDLARVEGPYGRFVFDGGKHNQIWVGGGVGITPFVARMRQLIAHDDGRQIDLFYATREPDALFLALITRMARDARVRLHIFEEATDGRLDADRIRNLVPDWRSADLWFCGPSRFGSALSTSLRAAGMHRADFHQELFSMR